MLPKITPKEILEAWEKELDSLSFELNNLYDDNELEDSWFVKYGFMYWFNFIKFRNLKFSEYGESAEKLFAMLCFCIILDYVFVY